MIAPSRGLAGLVCLALVGCAPAGDEHGDEHAEHAEHAEAGPRNWATVAVPSDRGLLEAPAQTVGAAKDRAAIAAAFPGRIEVVHVRPGDRVEVGTPLFEIAMPEVLRAAASVSAADTRLGSFRRRRDELEALRKKGLAKSSQVFEVEAQLTAVKAERQVGTAVLRATGIEAGDRGALLRSGTVALTSPVAGIVTDVPVSTGEWREPAQGPVVRIVAEGTVRVEAHVTRPIPEGVTVAFVAADGRRLELEGTPLASVIEPDTGLTRTWLEPTDATARWAHGVRGRLVVGGTEELRQVPAAALKMKEGAAVVLVQDQADAHGVRAVPVQVVSTSGTTALVTGELAVGDRIAVDAADVLGYGVELEGGHVH